MAGSPKQLAERPTAQSSSPVLEGDVLSNVLRTIRLSGSLQFCVMSGGDWHTDGKPSLAKLGGGPTHTIPFHILAEGSCWLRMEGREWILAAGDIVAFPFGTGHALGAGTGGPMIEPVHDLPPKPWREIPVLRYGSAGRRVRLLCGYLQCDTMNFRPLRDAMPSLLHARTGGSAQTAWLHAAIKQIVAEADTPRAGSISMLERLSEITFIEMLRQQILAGESAPTGWLAALADPSLAKCLALIHESPRQDWSVQDLSAASGLSRSTLTERFETILGISPMRYVREWRLCLASVALRTTSKAISTVAYDAGYGTEAAFNRAFSRAFGLPPATWRQNAKRSSITAQ